MPCYGTSHAAMVFRACARRTQPCVLFRAHYISPLAGDTPSFPHPCPSLSLWQARKEGAGPCICTDGTVQHAQASPHHKQPGGSYAMRTTYTAMLVACTRIAHSSHPAPMVDTQRRLSPMCMPSRAQPRLLPSTMPATGVTSMAHGDRQEHASHVVVRNA